MKNLIKDIHELVGQEYDRASEKFGAKHNSPHEAYAVIKEELEEAQESVSYLKQELDLYWQAVKQNDTGEQMDIPCGMILSLAETAAAELVQVAAMAHKALQGYGKEDTPCTLT